MPADPGWLAQMSPEHQAEFLRATHEFRRLRAELESVSAVAAMEVLLADQGDVTEVHGAWCSTSVHLAAMAELQRQMSVVTGRLAQITEPYA